MSEALTKDRERLRAQVKRQAVLLDGHEYCVNPTGKLIIELLIRTPDLVVSREAIFARCMEGVRDAEVPLDWQKYVRRHLYHLRISLGREAIETILREGVRYCPSKLLYK